MLMYVFIHFVHHVLANKRKATIPPQHQAKKFKADSASKDEVDNQQQQSEALMQAKKEMEYQTNIAICEVQLEELKYVILFINCTLFLECFATE